jgi:hypothetical protein
MASFMVAGDAVRFPMAVAAASAAAHDPAGTQTASALPKLKEWPTVPDDVHTAAGC